jgi:transposase
MSTRRSKQSYTPEFRAEAVREVIEGSRPIAAVARDLGIIEQTLGNWVKAWREEHADDEPPLTLPERARLREAERQLRELRLENEFLKKAAAYFAKDRP